MTTFRTTFEIKPSPHPFTYRDQYLCMGSCFAEHIGERLRAGKFLVETNPFGIQYNALSISRALGRLLSERPYKHEDLVEQNGLWQSFDHHSKFSSLEAEVCLNALNSSLATGANHLKQSSWLVLTFGTSFVYMRKDNGQPVSNCHKFPSVFFEKKQLSLQETIEVLSATFEALWQRQPDLRILLTVSPVRHLRDGVLENQVSKATLRLAVDALERGFGRRVVYFPAYELVLDDLRDYRFFAADMVHPSETAIDYVWERLMETFFAEATRMHYKTFAKIRRAMLHRPFQPESPSHLAFLKQFGEETKRQMQLFPQLNWEKEWNYFVNTGKEAFPF